MARNLTQRAKFFACRGRLESNLNRQSDLDEKLKAAFPELWLPLIGDDTPIILDFSDIAKPLAKRISLEIRCVPGTIPIVK